MRASWPLLLRKKRSSSGEAGLRVNTITDLSSLPGCAMSSLFFPFDFFRVSSIDCKGCLSSSTIVRGRRCLNMFPIDHGRSSQYILFYSITTICTNSHLISQAFFCQPRNGAWHGTEESIHTFLSPSPWNIILLPQVEKEEPTSRCQIYLISFSCCF